MPDPWEQLPNEPDAAFIRFKEYLNLGPRRSVDEAYRKHAGKPKKARKSPDVTPGNWKDDCTRFRWVERAGKWDIANLDAASRRAAALFVESVVAGFAMTLRGMDTQIATSSTEAVENLKELAGFVRLPGSEQRAAEPGKPDPGVEPARPGNEG